MSSCASSSRSSHDPLVVAGELRGGRLGQGARTSRDGGRRCSSRLATRRAVAPRRTRGSTRAGRSAARRRASRRSGPDSGRRAPTGRRRRRRRAPTAGSEHRLGGLDVGRSGEDRQPVEEPAAAVVEQVVAPGDRATQRLLARRQVATARGQARRADARAGVRIASGDSSLTRAAASSIASGMPCSRAAIAATAGAFSLVTANVGRTAFARSMNSRTAAYCPTAAASMPRAPAGQVHPLDAAQRRTGPAGPAGPGPGTPARPTRAGPPGSWRRSSGPARPGAGRRRPAPLEDLLEVVEDAAARDAAPATSASTSATGWWPALGDADRRRDPRRDEHRVADGLERHEEDAVREPVRDQGREGDRQARLAGPARSGEGQQSRALEQGLGLGQLVLATDERRQLAGQVGRSRLARPRWREGGRQAVGVDLGQPLRPRSGRAAGTPRGRGAGRRPAAIPRPGPGSRPRRGSGRRAPAAAMRAARLMSSPTSEPPTRMRLAGVDAHPDADVGVRRATAPPRWPRCAATAARTAAAGGRRRRRRTSRPRSPPRSRPSSANAARSSARCRSRRSP